MSKAPTRVLVADDSPVARAAVTRALRALGIDLVETDSAASAKAVDPATIAAAVLDLELGDGDGVEVANALRAAAPRLPIAFFSAAAAGALTDGARALGLVFAKPAELDALVSWTANVVNPA